MRLQELEADEIILEKRVQKMIKANKIFRKLFIVDIDALLEFYLPIICFVGTTNTSQIIH